MVPALRSELGDGLIEGLLTIALLLFVVAVAIQALGYVHARSVATTAAQDGARAAATGGQGAGIARATAVLDAAGDTGVRLQATARTGATTVTVIVDGQAPGLFPVPGALADVSASATLPSERYHDPNAAS